MNRKLSMDEIYKIWIDTPSIDTSKCMDKPIDPAALLRYVREETK